MTASLNSEPDQIARAFQQLVSERNKLPKIVTNHQTSFQSIREIALEQAKRPPKSQ